MSKFFLGRFVCGEQSPQNLHQNLPTKTHPAPVRPTRQRNWGSRWPICNGRSTSSASSCCRSASRKNRGGTQWAFTVEKCWKQTKNMVVLLVGLNPGFFYIDFQYPNRWCSWCSILDAMDGGKRCQQFPAGSCSFGHSIWVVCVERRVFWGWPCCKARMKLLDRPKLGEPIAYPALQHILEVQNFGFQ